jgi:hypothetical protein
MSVSPHWVPIETEDPLLHEDDEPKRSSAIGTIDRYCHILVGQQAHYTRTLCGLSLVPPQTYGHEPPPKRCPNGHPSCPECAQLDQGSS